MFYAANNENYLNQKGTIMFNKTNLIICATSLATGALIALGVFKLVRNDDRIARKSAQEAIASMDDYLQEIYHTRAHKALDLIYSSDASSELTDKIRDLLDCPL